MSFEEENKLPRHEKKDSAGRKHSHEARNSKKNFSEVEAEESAKQTLISMAFSLVLVGMALLFVVFFHNFLKGHDYTGPVNDANYTEESQAGDKEELVVDEKFKACSIIIKELKDQEFCATKNPGLVEEGSKRLQNGQILDVVKKGSYNGKDYLCLKNHTYVEADEDHIQYVKEYLPLEGYIVITYISSAGVRLRSWIDFDAENIVRSVYVGDKIIVKAMVTLEDGNSAFLTEDGLYITTDSRYFTDSTNLKDKLQPATEAGATTEQDVTEEVTEEQMTTGATEATGEDTQQE